MRTVGIGKQDFEKIVKDDYFYIDKTHFIKEWRESGDDVTLITRPRRFGKTLTMSMVEQFFSVKYAGRGDLFNRSLFNSAFKTNPNMERAIMTGITRVSRESIFSDLNNLEVITTTSMKYADCFGFTEEVFAALDEYGLSDKKKGIKEWYDGFTFGRLRDIYNPWSIINFLDKRQFKTYWANTSSNSLVNQLVREGSRDIKASFEALMREEALIVQIDEQIVYEQLAQNESAIWSLLLASGYLKVHAYNPLEFNDKGWMENYELKITNHEVKTMFQNMIHGWFQVSVSDYNDALL